MNLTNEQLVELTERIQARLAEFDTLTAYMPKISRCVVRIAYEIIDQWQHEQPMSEPAGSNGHYIGLQRGQVEASSIRYEVMSDFGGMSQTLVPETLVSNGHYAPEPEPVEPEPAAPTIPAAEVVEESTPALAKESTSEETPPKQNERADKSGEKEDKPADPPLSRAAAATLGPEHTVVTPLKPQDERLPDPDEAREKLATALAKGGKGALASVLKKPRTLAEVDALQERESEMHEIIDALKGMAVDGKMPSINHYALHKPSHLPAWQTIMSRYNILTWRQMAALCGLTYAPGRGPGFAAKETDTDGEDEEMSGKGYKRSPEQLAKVRERRAQARQTEQARKPAKPIHRREPSGRGSFVAVGGAEPTKLQVTRDAVIAEVQRQAMAGHMPTMSFFDGARPAVWPSAAALCLKFNTTWQSLAQEAGLKWERVRGTPTATPEPVA